MDQPARHRVRLLQQRGDQARRRATRSATRTRSSGKGGWTLDHKGRLQLKAGGRLRKLLSIFYNPDLPTIDDYGEPWTYDYQTLINAPLGTPNPSAHSHSALTGRTMDMQWGSNWDDDLAGAPEHAAADPNLSSMDEQC